MQEYFKISGSYPNYNDINLTLHRNHPNYFLFSWEDIFRSYRYIPDINDFEFRMIFIINSKLNCEDNVLVTLTSKLGEISTYIDTDKDQEFILCQMDSVITKDLRNYDDGLFTFDIKSKTDSTSIIKFKNFTRLFSGNWSIDFNSMTIDFNDNGDTNDSSKLNGYYVYNTNDDDSLQKFTYDVINPNDDPEPEPEEEPKTKEELELLNCKKCSFNDKCPIYNDPLYPENRVLYTFVDEIGPSYISDKPDKLPDGREPIYVVCANGYKSYQDWKNKKKTIFDDLTYLDTEDDE